MPEHSIPFCSDQLSSPLYLVQLWEDERYAQTCRGRQWEADVKIRSRCFESTLHFKDMTRSLTPRLPLHPFVDRTLSSGVDWSPSSGIHASLEAEGQRSSLVTQGQQSSCTPGTSQLSLEQCNQSMAGFWFGFVRIWASEAGDGRWWCLALSPGVLNMDTRDYTRRAPDGNQVIGAAPPGKIWTGLWPAESSEPDPQPDFLL